MKTFRKRNQRHENLLQQCSSRDNSRQRFVSLANIVQNTQVFLQQDPINSHHNNNCCIAFHQSELENSESTILVLLPSNQISQTHFRAGAHAPAK